MKKILLYIIPCILFATHGCPRIEDSIKGRDTIIKVLTHENLDGALIEVKGAYTAFNVATGKKVTSSYFQNRHYLSATANGLKWGKVFPSQHQIKIVPSSPETTFLIDGIQYCGNLYAFSIGSSICLVVEVDVELYVKSILSGKFSNKKLHQSTLETLAIVMRTNLYQKIAASTNPFWDIKASEHAFKGSSLLQVDSKADAAAIATKDLILIHNNRPFPAMWTNHSAGKTADYKIIFRKDVNSPTGVFVPYSQKNREKTSWKASISRKDLERISGIEAITSIETYKDKATQKVYGLFVKGKNQSFRELSFLELRDKIGKQRILSNDCTVKLNDNKVDFSGYGEGLGVGICLYSADQMAGCGKSTGKILSEFFPDTKIIKLEYVPQVFFENNEILDDK